MLSYTTGKLGRGWVYAVNNAMDETGAMIGPLAMAAILFFHGDYRIGFGVLVIPGRGATERASRDMPVHFVVAP